MLSWLHTQTWHCTFSDYASSFSPHYMTAEVWNGWQPAGSAKELDDGHSPWCCLWDELGEKVAPDPSPACCHPDRAHQDCLLGTPGHLFQTSRVPEGAGDSHPWSMWKLTGMREPKPAQSTDSPNSKSPTMETLSNLASYFFLGHWKKNVFPPDIGMPSP